MTGISAIARRAFILIPLLTTQAGADYEVGQRAWDAGQRSEAIAEWQKSAADGDARSMLALGQAYASGMGVVQDYVQAYKWFNLAASRGEGAAVAARDALTARMSLQEQAEARRQALEWQPGSAATALSTAQPVSREDMTSTAIREAQTILATLGYRPGPADGIWGQRTTQALQAFLRDARLSPPDTLTESLRLLRAAAQQAEPVQTEPQLLKPLRVPLPQEEEPQPFTIIAEPEGARVRIVNIEEPYAVGMALAPGVYEVEVSTSGYETKRATIQHGTVATEQRIALVRMRPRSFTIVTEPTGAQVRLLNTETEYQPGMTLPMGQYEVEVSAPGYETKRATVQHGTTSTERRVALVQIRPPFTIITRPTVSQVRLLNTETEYQPGMTLPMGQYEVEVSAPGYETKRATVQHGTAATERRITLVRVEPQRPVGARFRDCPVCPEVVVTSTGSFLMGSPASEDGHDDTESPQLEVTISRPLAVGVYEVTFAEWSACVSNGGCDQHRPDDASWGRGRQPVINVSWGDAQAYVRWLAKETGRAYRLPSEAEWEYVARAGTQTPFHFGQTLTPLQANYDTTYVYEGGWKAVDRRRTIPVGSFAPNRFGLYDIHGNAWEWTQDCWSRNLIGVPQDGRARETENCGKRVLRGGAWIFSPRILRSASRNRYAADYRYPYVGFRVVRTLPYLTSPGTDENDTGPERATSPGGTSAGR